MKNYVLEPTGYDQNSLWARKLKSQLSCIFFLSFLFCLSRPLLPLDCFSVGFSYLIPLLLSTLWTGSFISQLCFIFFKDVKIECLQQSQELNLQKLRNSELILTEAKQKMRELTINIKMKEDLIKELIKTGNTVL